MNPAERGKLKDECDEAREKTIDRLYEATMANQWEKVVDIMQNTQIDHATKLTKGSDTALHVAISSYHPKTPPSHEKSLAQMIRAMEDRSTLRRVLDTKNHFGDTPLHLAAAVGWLGIFDTVIQETRLHDLLENRNSKGETPFFIAAQYAHLNIFLRLYDKFKPGESSAKRKDGNTILHRAIFQENFELAYVIVECYPKMVMSKNEVGESPLHLLAEKPNVFKSISDLPFYDSIIYNCVFVDKLRSINKIPRDHPTPDRSTSESGPDYPENYTTCVKIFVFLSSPILIIRDGIVAIFTNRPSRRGTDVENHYHQNHEPRTKGKKGYRSYHNLFPDNYVTCIDLFKFAMKVILVILGVGFWGIRKIEKKKKKYLNALEVLDIILEKESSYKYDNDGQQPEIDGGRDSGKLAPPKEEPQWDDDGNYQDTKATTTGIQGEIAPEPKVNKDTALLVAVKTGILEMVKEIHRKCPIAQELEPKGFIKKDSALLTAVKTGILEMVKKIHRKWPIAIQELDSEEKNVLMLAAEYRHTTVFNYLVNQHLPEHMFQQLDKDGNSILHLAAKLKHSDFQPWRIPGAALQMQGEMKWLKHVKESLSTRSISHPNRKGETPSAVFSATHKDLKKDGNEWLIKTSESCSVVAALIAAVAFATSSSVPGGLVQDKGIPVFQDETAFDVFAVASLVALCLSVTALVFFLAIITSRFEERDFMSNLPNKLLKGLSSLFASIAAILLSFCSGHTFTLREELKIAVIPIYASVTIPVALFVIAQLPLYIDLLLTVSTTVPWRSYKVFYY